MPKLKKQIKTVQDLIDILSQYPKDLDVFLYKRELKHKFKEAKIYQAYYGNNQWVELTTIWD